MDPATMGALAIGLLTPYLRQAGTQAAQKLGQDAASEVEKLLALVRKKFAADQDSYASETLARLEAQPSTESRQRALADVLAEKAAADPGFRTQLEGVLQSAQANPSTQQFLTQISGGQVGQVLNVGSIDSLRIGRPDLPDPPHP
jgi:hypothetical protein